MSTPVVHDGEVIGTINIYSRLDNAFSDTDADMAAICATAVANSLVKAELLTSPGPFREQLQT